MAWPKGVPKPEGCKPPRRKKGVPNKASRPWKELVTGICESVPHQEKLAAACLERPEMMFRAAEFAFGKPKESVEIKGEFRMIQWPDREDIPDE